MINRSFTLPGYHLTEQIYDGSRTRVFRGISVSDHRPVVIKILKSEHPNFSELVQFRNQYTLAKTLDHPGIIKPIALLEYGNGFALIMEDIGGVSLSEWGIQSGVWGMGKQPDHLDLFFTIAIQLVNILEFLYQNRVIHKDIKPQNILIHPRTKEIKLIDFSISSLLPRETQELHNPNVLEGTLAYLSPEQSGRMNRGIDYRTDFYSLGVTFYELLTGQLPFQSIDPMELVHSHIAELPIPPIERVPTVPVMVNNIINKLMSKAPEDRYQSVFGLRYDLEHCWHQWQEQNTIHLFNLASRDICDRFIIPEKLYGRESEVNTLLAAFDRVTQGYREIMLIAGFSGIGKTAVVNEVHKPILRQRGYFIKGKFDQFKRDIPFSAWVQAFQNLMEQLLTVSRQEIEQWKAIILAALGENGQVIIDVIPELEQLIGKQPPVPELAGSAAQNRFNLLFGQFIRVFATQDHPLVIFLDDLQWADLGSLKLIQLLMGDRESSHLLLIGAYRDNEILPAHPLMITLDEIAKESTTLHQIRLSPLDQPSLNGLIADTLSCSLETALPLTDLVFSKTKGNPFFTTQFLKSLHEEGLIYFDFSCGSWQCHISQIKSLTLTDDVVEFMALQLQKLPKNTQNILKLAACIGNEFDLLTLAIIHEQSPAETATNLWRALQDGLILPESEIYKFFQNSATDRTDELSTLSPNQFSTTIRYRFLHDRVQQAAYSLIPEDEKQSTHLKIGQLLLKNTSKDEREEKIFDIVNQLNIGSDLIASQTQRDELAQLNLIAGRKAKDSTAHAAAKQYLTVGMKLLAVDCWQTHYNLTLAIYESAIEAAYLSTDFEQMERWANVVLQTAKTILDKVKVYEIKIQTCMAQGKQLEAVKIGLQVLNLLGVTLPESATELDIQRRLEETSAALKGKKIEDLINLPLMIDPIQLAAMRMLSSLFSPIYIAAPGLLPLIPCEQVNLSIKYGNTSFSAFGYANYAAILNAVLQDIDTAYEFGQLALNLVEKLKAKELKTRTFIQVGVFTLHWKSHINTTFLLFQDAYKTGIETGDFEFASYAAMNKCQYAYFSGHELTEVEREMTTYIHALEDIKQQAVLSYIQIFHQVVINLLFTTENPCLLLSDRYNCEAMLPIYQKANDRLGLHFLYCHKLIIAYLFGDYSESFKNAVKARLYLDGATGLFNVPIFHFYDSLAALAIYADQDSTEQGFLTQTVIKNQEKMKLWAAQAPMNHLHKFYLVEAERYRILGEKLDAMEMYDRAIKGAKENNYINEEALANELAAKFYWEWGKEKIAQAYLMDAYYAYARWGAKAKVEDLEKRYPQLLAPILNQNNIITPEDTLTNIATGTIIFTSTGISENLDLTTVIKASQSLSGEIHFNQLLSNLMQIMIENAGAEKGSLILLEGDSLMLVAQCVSGETCNLDPISLVNAQDIPISLIHYVSRTSKTLVINDGTNETTFAADPYIIQQQPKSILCHPIQNQGQLIGILYLENNLTTNAFTTERLQVLKILSSQAAISIKNAQLYATLEAKVEERTQQFQESQAKFLGILQIAGDGIISVDETQRICLFNHAAEQIFGYTAQEVIDQPLEILLPAAVRDRHRQHIHQFGSDRVPFRSMGKTERSKIQGQRKNGELFPAEASISRLKLKDGLLFTVIMNDITERQKAEEAIQQKNQELANTLQQLKATQDELIQSEKMAALGQLIAGIAHEVNTPLGAIHSSAENIANFLNPTLEQLPTLFQTLLPEEGQIFLDLLLRSLAQESGLSTKEKRKLKRELKNLLETLEIESADSVADRLVLMGIPNQIDEFIPLLKRPDSLPILDVAYKLSELKRGIKTINIATQRASKVVFALKAYARYDSSSKLILANLIEGIETVLTLYQNQLKHDVNVIKQYSEVPPIFCYPDELNQVWTNLIHNALQAMDYYGTLTLEVTRIDEKVRISITDTGKGIPKEIQTKIFEPFFTTKPAGEGSGLGLDIVNKIIDKHHGSIEVESIPGNTTFTVYIPINLNEN